MINYEVMFIIDPTLEDEKKDAADERVKGIIAAEGEVGNVDVWGEGYYVVIDFKAEPTLPAELDRRLKISEDFMRHIIVNKDA